jgi:hypothetical protein
MPQEWPLRVAHVAKQQRITAFSKDALAGGAYG